MTELFVKQPLASPGSSKYPYTTFSLIKKGFKALSEERFSGYIAEAIIQCFVFLGGSGFTFHLES